jgi:Tfp pilus assembly protein PilF
MQELHIYRGLVYSRTARPERAAGEFRAAIAIDPQNESAWRELCHAFILAKEKENALIAVEQYIEAFPQSGTAWRFRGYVLNMMERREEAIPALMKAIEIDSADYFSWFELGSTFERLKRIDEAADAFRATLRIRPRDAQASNYLGYIWAEAGINLDSAKVLIEDALAVEPNNGAYLDSYAWVFYQMGDYERALHYMLKALGQEDIQTDPVPYEHLGDIYFKLENYAAAAAAYERAIELKTEDAERISGRLTEIRNIMSGRGP